MSFPKAFRTWNNFKDRPQDYYLKTVNRLLRDEHPNHLKELSLALQHLERFPTFAADELRPEIASLFKRLAADAGHAGNYEIIGEILTAYGRIPERFRTQTGFFLPPSDDSSELGEGLAKLTIRVELYEWTLKRVTYFMTLLAELEEQLPDGPEQVIQVIEQGSLIVQIVAGSKMLLASFQSLIDFRRSGYELRLKAIELEHKKIELEYLRRSKELELRKFEQDIEKNDLEIAGQRLVLMKEIKEHTDYDHLAYGKTKKGKRAAEIAATIKQEFPVLHIRLEDR